MLFCYQLTLLYRRKLLTVLEVTGFIGGLFELFEISFGLILGYISSYFFKQQIIQELKEGKKEYESLKTQFEELKKITMEKAEERKTPEINEEQKQLRHQNLW